jgi:hypothetical protein
MLDIRRQTLDIGRVCIRAQRWVKAS